MHVKNAGICGKKRPEESVQTHSNRIKDVKYDPPAYKEKEVRAW
jgi:hypothetical protein